MNEVSSATRLAEELATQSIPRSDINDWHLREFYSALNRHSSAPGSSDPYLLDDLQAPAAEHDALAVIIETRPHPALALVIDNVINTCHIPVQLFHGSDNLDFILQSSLKPHINSGQLQLSALNTAALNANSYNSLLLNRTFWNSLQTRAKVLIFQTDALICQASQYKLSDFFSFDYIGSCWQRERPIGLIIDGGSGGLSLRDWQLSTQCLQRFAPALWPGGEDGYFAFHMELIGGKVATQTEAARFSSQEWFTDNSFGVHQPQWMSDSDKLKLLAYCPEAGRII
ncbi:MAG: DUF5672 family protein [Pseudomonadales bacterium]